ncbi:serine carboxypeptidase [Calocera viscosa TUFC12733]|uniref:Carboxypeptidase n=1 Tax=Calocera viscosa (strain TUFC12733) TaxID=1330018 RepID=A0A167MKA1_CALVF|nr:serine carboxypeptidase [Calocera viscosa TUFC12733]
MQLRTVLSILLPALGALASQIPRINNVIGDVRDELLTAPRYTFAAPKTDYTTAGSSPLRYVENSGVCETTPGVYQASGYADIAYNQSLFFWFFAARNDPYNAPLSIWMNGGPGSSSMLGLFQELGPCRVTTDGLNYTLNPYGWNDYSNMLFIDQPTTVGFSYGTADVGTAAEAAQGVWTLLQMFLSDSKFAHLQENQFAVWTESYGGHYGPAVAYHILQQNALIDAGMLSGIKLNFQTLGIGNGLTNPLVQYPQYLQYALSNAYTVPLVNTTVSNNASAMLYESGGCLDQISACYDSTLLNGSPNYTACATAQQYCNRYVLSPLVGIYNDYDVRVVNPDPYPPDLTTLLRNPALTSKIGVPSFINWTETSYAVYDNFAATGDWMTNSAPYLEAVINAGIRTTLYDGDADYICNYKGFEAVAANLNTKFSSIYAATNFSSWTVDGNPAGMIKNAGTFSFVQVAGAGHEVPAYGNGPLAEGQAALVFFTQTMKGLPLTST